MSGVASPVARSVARPVASAVVNDSGGGQPEWTPAQLTGLEYWFDASDAATITDDGGGLVSQWQDKSGNARHLTAATTFRPQTGVRTLNGLNLLSNSASTSLATPTESPILPQPLHYFQIVVPQSNGGDHRMMNGKSNTNRAFAWMRTNWDAFAGAIGAGSVAVPIAATFVSILFNGAASKIWVNTGAPDTVDVGGNSLGGFRSNGQAETGSGGIVGDIAEQIVCSADNTANLANVKAYFAEKWGLAL